jgi:hypothetical protein
LSKSCGDLASLRAEHGASLASLHFNFWPFPSAR